MISSINYKIQFFCALTLFALSFYSKKLIILRFSNSNNYIYVEFMNGYIISFWNIRKIYVMKIERKKNYVI